MVPDWYLAKDTDGDGQVAMKEFSQSWDAATLAEFVRVDVNGDGFITPRDYSYADMDRDGRITAVEFVRALRSR